jgi:hypothetical protein
MSLFGVSLSRKQSGVRQSQRSVRDEPHRRSAKGV